MKYRVVLKTTTCTYCLCLKKEKQQIQPIQLKQPHISFKAQQKILEQSTKGEHQGKTQRQKNFKQQYF